MHTLCIISNPEQQDRTFSPLQPTTVSTLLSSNQTSGRQRSKRGFFFQDRQPKELQSSVSLPKEDRNATAGFETAVIYLAIARLCCMCFRRRHRYGTRGCSFRVNPFGLLACVLFLVFNAATYMLPRQRSHVQLATPPVFVVLVRRDAMGVSPDVRVSLVR